MCYVYIFLYTSYIKGISMGFGRNFPTLHTSQIHVESLKVHILILDNYNCIYMYMYIYIYIYILYPHTWSLTHHVESTQPRFQVKMPIRSTSDMITTR